jgi:hypothetical protein
MNSKLTITLAVAIAACAVAPAQAATGTVPFTGIVTTTCVLTVGLPGVMAPTADYGTLSSSASGGIAGTVQALATGGNFKVSAVAPTSFTLAPPGGGDNVNFAASYSAAGSTTIGTTPGANQTALNAGLTNLSVNLAATKSAGVFAGGAYAAEVIVRCE